MNETDLISRWVAIDALTRDEEYNEDIPDRADGVRDAIITIMGLPSAQRWIPCEERLPEPKKAVLGYAPRWNNIFALYYDLKSGWMVWSPIRDDCFPNMYGDIVAWMPMPDPYEEKQI